MCPLIFHSAIPLPYAGSRGNDITNFLSIVPIPISIIISHNPRSIYHDIDIIAQHYNIERRNSVFNVGNGSGDYMA